VKTGKGSRFVEVPLVDVDRHLRGLGYRPDTDEDVRETRREVTYSKETQKVFFPVPGRYVVSPAFERAGELQFSGHNMMVDARTMQEMISSSLEVARVKCLDAAHDPKLDRPGHAVVFPLGLENRTVAWVITQHQEQRGIVAVRVYTSFSQGEDTARELGKDAIRVAVVYDANGFVRGLSDEQRVFRTGTVQGVLQRISERIAQAEAVKLRQCARCAGPAYANSGRCVLPECRATVQSVDRFKGGPCARCGGATYTDSGKCIKRDCPGRRRR
jgi:hypothetical protein